MPKTTRERANPGAKASHTQLEANSRVSPPSMPPHEIVLNGTPTPKKLRDDSVIMIEPIDEVVTIINGANVLVATCLNIIRK